jgi:hypothetical protein
MHRSWVKGDFEISTDPARVDVGVARGSDGVDRSSNCGPYGAAQERYRWRKECFNVDVYRVGLGAEVTPEVRHIVT